MMNGEEILKEMNAFSVNAVQAAPEQGSGEEALPFESLDDYSTDPIGFEELADMVNDKVKYFFSLSAKYNHRSSEYLEVCGFLERGIKYLGSCCLTGVLLKKKGHDLPKLEDLSTHWLYGMVSFNIRKLNRTVDEDLSRSGPIPSRWLDMQFRYINLAERLRSTEKKIYDLTNSYWLNSDKYIEHALMFSEEAPNRVFVKRHVRKPDFRLAPSFPVIGKEAVTQSAVPGSQNASEQPASDAQLSPLNADRSTRCKGIAARQRSGIGTRKADENAAPVPQLSASGFDENIEQEPETGNGDRGSGNNESNSHSSSLIPDPEEPVPAFMAILERARERGEAEGDGKLHLTFEDLDTLAFDRELPIYDPELAKLIRREYKALFPGLSDP